MTEGLNRTRCQRNGWENPRARGPKLGKAGVPSNRCADLPRQMSNRLQVLEVVTEDGLRCVFVKIFGNSCAHASYLDASDYAFSLQSLGQSIELAASMQ